jgi:hypothetical protein
MRIRQHAIAANTRFPEKSVDRFKNSLPQMGARYKQ